jgi:hypothetical protein
MDPVGTVIAAGAYAASKVLGPTYDHYGKELKELIARRQTNVGRIFLKAEKMLGDRINEDGAVHPKVLKEILDDGSYAEDELAADYFGGVLASSRTGVARDDRGASFAKMVGRLSVYQLRCHYIIYRAIKEQFDGREFTPSLPRHRKNMAIYISFPPLINAMELGGDEPFNPILSHVLFGMSRESLIEDTSQYGTEASLKEEWPDAPNAGALFTPSALGIELFMWAHGLGHVEISDYLNPDVSFESDIELPAITGVLPTNPPQQETATDNG